MIAQQEAVRILDQWGQGAPWTRHCLAVADRAAAVGAVLQPHWRLDRAFLWSAALLHDIGRHATHDPVLHGVAGYQLLAGLGHAKEARVCASHVLFGLRPDEALLCGLPVGDFRPESIEEKLVALIDYLVEFDQPTTLARRFASLRRRNAKHPFFRKRLERAFRSAKAFMTEIEQTIGASLEHMLAVGQFPAQRPVTGQGQGRRGNQTPHTRKGSF
jgi:uncharacterized protein